MRSVFRARNPAITTLVALTLLGAGVSGAAAASCSERNKECLRFCDTSFKGRPACTSQCADALPKCQQNGCWVTRMTDKCGYTRG